MLLPRSKRGQGGSRRREAHASKCILRSIGAARSRPCVCVGRGVCGGNSSKHAPQRQSSAPGPHHCVGCPPAPPPPPEMTPKWRVCRSARGRSGLTTRARPPLSHPDWVSSTELHRRTVTRKLRLGPGEPLPTVLCWRLVPLGHGFEEGPPVLA